VGRSPPFPDPKTVKNDRENKKGVADMEAVHPFLEPKSPNVYPKHRLPCPEVAAISHTLFVQMRSKERENETKRNGKGKKKRERPVLCPAPLVSTQRM
jgi:hypothetical protein